MNGKVKAGLFTVALAALLVGVYFVGFYYGYYQRYAELNVDVGTMSMHIQVWVTYVDGSVELVKDGVALDNAGVLTIIGKNWIEDQLGDSPSTDPAKWISLSTNTSTPLASWTQIPTEITTGGLERAAGTYSSTGDGQWKIEKQFTASATHTNVQLTGLQWAITPLDGNLLGADTLTPVTLNSGDKLTVTWTVTVS